MTWQTPKTDWKSSDYINIEDWARIEGNTQYLGDLFNLTLGALEHDRNHTGFAFSSYLNYLASNILTLPSGYVTPVGWQFLRTDWEALESLGFTTISIMEKNLSILKNTYDNNKAQQSYVGEIYCGEKGGML